MMPRKIHFVWLGSALPKLREALIGRCRALHPRWEVRVWGDGDAQALLTSMDTGLAQRLGQAGLAFATKCDLVRYHVVAHEGGIYLDTDFLVLRPMEALRKATFFAAYQEPGILCNGVFGAVPGHPIFERIFERLRKTDYALPPHLLAGPQMFSPLCQEAEQKDSAVRLLSPASFSPVHYGQKHDLNAWLACDLSRTYGAHLWAHSWGDHGGDDSTALIARVGAVMLNPSGSK